MPSASRFADNGIISLLGQSAEHQLSGSTSRNIALTDVIDRRALNAALEQRLDYGSARGHEGLRSAIAQEIGVKADNVLTTPGSTLALFMLAFELCSGGGKAVAPIPAYPATLAGLTAVGASLQTIRMHFDAGYLPDIGAFEALIGADTKLVSVASPHSPSGRCLPDETLDAILQLVLDRAPEAYLLVDEAYQLATYADGRNVTSFAGRSKRVITTGSLSKAHGAPGLRVGWISTTDEELTARLMNARLNIFDCASVLDEEIAHLLIANSSELLAKQQRELGRNLDLVAQWQAQQSALVDWIRPDAGGLCCIRLRADAFSEEAVVSFMQEADANGISLGKGSWFGESDRVLRLGFGALAPDALQQGLDALSRILQTSAA